MYIHRSQTKFDWDPYADKTVMKFGVSNVGLVMADIAEFEGHYCSSLSDRDLPDRYHFKPLKGQTARDTHGRKYELWQIYVAPSARYRAILLRSSDLLTLWWVWVFKKQRMREQQEIAHAALRAKLRWNELWS